MSDLIYSDLLAAQRLVYEPAGLICKNVVNERESKEYSACDFELNGRHVKFRTGKITPTKVGQFVTLWKRIGNGSIMPYDITDPVDLFVVSVRSNEHVGQFVFPKMILYEKGILSKNGKGGKRAMRIYPSWDVTESKQAKKTQEWQLNYFIETSPDKLIDIQRLQNLIKI